MDKKGIRRSPEKVFDEVASTLEVPQEPNTYKVMINDSGYMFDEDGVRLLCDIIYRHANGVNDALSEFLKRTMEPDSRIYFLEKYFDFAIGGHGVVIVFESNDEPATIEFQPTLPTGDGSEFVEVKEGEIILVSYNGDLSRVTITDEMAKSYNGAKDKIFPYSEAVNEMNGGMSRHLSESARRPSVDFREKFKAFLNEPDVRIDWLIMTGDIHDASNMMVKNTSLITEARIEAMMLTPEPGFNFTRLLSVFNGLDVDALGVIGEARHYRFARMATSGLSESKVITFLDEVERAPNPESVGEVLTAVSSFFYASDAIQNKASSVALSVQGDRVRSGLKL